MEREALLAFSLIVCVSLVMLTIIWFKPDARLLFPLFYMTLCIGVFICFFTFLMRRERRSSIRTHRVQDHEEQEQKQEQPNKYSIRVNRPARPEQGDAGQYQEHN